jgi:hypothetical protein
MLAFHLRENIMFKIIYLVLGVGIIGFYLTSSWLGWEFAASGRNSMFGRMPFISGPRGGK